MASPKTKKGDGDGDAIKLITENRRARFDYAVEEKLEAGISLTGSEVKSLRTGTANLSDSYATPEGDQLFLYRAHIGAYDPASVFAHVPTRTRKLLLHRAEIDRWIVKVRERGYAIIPLRMYFRRGKAKIELALCRGKTHEDRRHDIKQRESQREMDRALRRR